MARYSRLVGPAANFTAPITLTRVTGFVITRYWDEGEVLLLGHAQFSNTSAARSFAQLTLFRDGSGAPATIVGQHLNTTDIGTLTFCYLLRVVEGYHTFELMASSNPTNTCLVLAQTASFIVIQLPLWDQVANLVDL